MKNYLYRISQNILNKLNISRIDRKIKRRERNSKELIKNKETDFLRWENNSELFENWNERTKILADYIKPNAKIIEFGAGNMFIKEYLKPILYAPTDIVKRFDETTVCDLNKPIEIDIKKYNTAVFSGVLEYVYDMDMVFDQLNKNSIKQIVLSYCCSDINPQSRAKNGWLSDFSKKDLEKIFDKYNYSIQNYQEWKKQSIFNLLKE